MYDTTAYDGGSYTETVNITSGRPRPGHHPARHAQHTGTSWTITEHLRCASTGEVSLGGYGLSDGGLTTLTVAYSARTELLAVADMSPGTTWAYAYDASDSLLGSLWSVSGTFEVIGTSVTVSAGTFDAEAEATPHRFVGQRLRRDSMAPTVGQRTRRGQGERHRRRPRGDPRNPSCSSFTPERGRFSVPPRVFRSARACLEAPQPQCFAPGVRPPRTPEVGQFRGQVFRHGLLAPCRLGKRSHERHLAHPVDLEVRRLHRLRNLREACDLAAVDEHVPLVLAAAPGEDLDSGQSPFARRSPGPEQVEHESGNTEGLPAMCGDGPDLGVDLHAERVEGLRAAWISASVMEPASNSNPG